MKVLPISYGALYPPLKMFLHMKMFPEGHHHRQMTIGLVEENLGVTTIVDQVIPKKLARRYMANLLIGSLLILIIIVTVRQHSFI